LALARLAASAGQIGVMLPMAKKTVPFTSTGIATLPNDKPVLYKILTDGGKVNYVGVAKRWRVQDRLREHLPDGPNPVPGKKVQIEQMASIKDARAKERRVIKRTQPPYNLQGK
jgi:excinuclease UvrABC nuclease subunit